MRKSANGTQNRLHKILLILICIPEYYFLAGWSAVRCSPRNGNGKRRIGNKWKVSSEPKKKKKLQIEESIKNGMAEFFICTLFSFKSSRIIWMIKCVHSIFSCTHQSHRSIWMKIVYENFRSGNGKEQFPLTVRLPN